MRLIRTLLYTPGNNWRMIQKARDLPADAIILDLEDAVPMAEKETARIFVRDGIPLIKSAGTQTFVRVNALTTGLTPVNEEEADPARTNPSGFSSEFSSSWFLPEGSFTSSADNPRAARRALWRQR